MRKYTMLPIGKLVSDVAVDPVHVRELADSIKVSGPISPVLVRDENLALIDGFHRVAAMKELGFNQVECIFTPCNDETFWDLRIMSASLHKAVTFARVVDWIDEVFDLSPWKNRYKNALILFEAVIKNSAPEEVATWAQSKAQAWGLAPATIRNWLTTKENLAKDVLEKAKASTYQGESLGLSPYIRVAEGLSGKPQLQKQVIDKVEKEGLTDREVRELTKAVREARDEEEAKDILSRPFSRTAEEVMREVRVERLISAPPVPEAREIIQKVEMASNVIELKLVWEQVATMANEVDLVLLDSLNEGQKEELAQSGERCIQASQKVVDYLRRKLGRLIELPRKES
jgi:hypothetical protein